MDFKVDLVLVVFMVCDFGDWVLDLWFVIFDVVLVEYI